MPKSRQTKQVQELRRWSEVLANHRPVNLNYNSGILVPEIRGYEPHDENHAIESGFLQPVIELLTHSQRRTAEQENRADVSMVDPGRYHCGIPFESAYRNVVLTNEIINHPSGMNLLPSYTPGDDIRDIMNDLVAQEHLEKEKNWLIERDFGKFV